MTNTDFITQLESISTSLRKECYARDPSLHYEVSRSDVAAPMFPPVLVEGEILGHSLDHLVHALYANDVDLDVVVDGWEELVNLQVEPLRGKKSASNVLRRVFPCFRPNARTVYDVMVQYLVLASYSSAFTSSLYARPTFVEIVHARGKMRLDRTGVTAPSGEYIRQRSSSSNLLASALQQGGATSHVRPHAFGAYRYYSETLPELESRIALVFSAAAAAGREAQEAFIGDVDVVVVQGGEDRAPSTRPWAKALMIVESATDNPIRRVIKALAPVASHAKLLDALMVFDPTASYHPMRRQMLKEAVLRLRSELTSPIPPAKQEALRLLQIQSQLKG